MRILLAIFLLSSCLWAKDSKWKWEAGATLGDPMPFAPQVGVRQDDWVFRLAPGFWYQEDLTFWSGASFSSSYAMIHQKWYGIEAGAGFHYFYAQAKDGVAITLNKALGQRVMYDVQWIQWMAAGPQISVRLFGLFTQFSIPVWQSGEIERNLEWRAGFLF